MRLGVSGVIWGTVLTTLFSNLLVPGIYLFRVLEIAPRAYLSRTLGPPLAGTLAASDFDQRDALHPSHTVCKPSVGPRAVLLLVHLVVASITYIGGYLLMPTGRNDLAELLAKVRRR